MYGIKIMSKLLDMIISLTANLVANKEEDFQSPPARGIEVPEEVPSTIVKRIKLGSPAETFIQEGK